VEIGTTIVRIVTYTIAKTGTTPVNPTNIIGLWWFVVG
jgi:hypothetical protein